MDNKVTKNTFFYKFFKVDFLAETLSLKQLIQRELLKAIDRSWKHLAVEIRQQIALELSDKIILTPRQKSSPALVYRCAIAFSFANLVGGSARSIAYEIISLLPTVKAEIAPDMGLVIAVTVVNAGWLDLTICDRNLVVWLNYIVPKISQQSDRKPTSFLTTESDDLNKLFPLQYICLRCTSLLQLGAREGLIARNENLTALKWQIERSFVINWHNDRGNLCLVAPQARDLLWQICLMLDYIGADGEYSFQHWLQFTEQISTIWLQFVAKCNFCGKLKQQNILLAIARLGLIALTYWCLQTILSRFNLIFPKDF